MGLICVYSPCLLVVLLVLFRADCVPDAKRVYGVRG